MRLRSFYVEPGQSVRLGTPSSRTAKAVLRRIFQRFPDLAPKLRLFKDGERFVIERIH